MNSQASRDKSQGPFKDNRARGQMAARHLQTAGHTIDSRQMPKSTGTEPHRRIDITRWIILGSLGLAVTVAIAGLGFAAGYLTAFHNAAHQLHANQRTIVNLRQQLQSARSQAARQSAFSAHGNWWGWWAGLPFQHMTGAIGQWLHRIGA